MTSEESHGQSLPAEFVENLRALFPEHGELSHEELILEQECVFQSLQINGRSAGGTPKPGQSSDQRRFLGEEGESSRSTSLESQLARDEAFARTLQEFGDDLDDSHIAEILGHIAGSSGGTPVSSRETSVSVRSIRSPDVSQDEVNPDEMTYEQLRSLGDSIGSESKGLSKEFLSRLPSSKYRTGFLSKKKKNEECVICLVKCKNGDYVTTLHCVHQYHTKCIKQWLKSNNTCPVCKEEVRDS